MRDRSGSRYFRAQRRPSAPREHNPLSGVLLVDKPAGPTSHDIVDAIRAKFGITKAGHGGTLDPQATGLLIVLLASGTRLSEKFIGSDKEYEGIMRLGVSTDTQDAQGIIISEHDPSGITHKMVEEAMARFKGDVMQMPPMTSAIKVDGKPLYKSARKGKVVERSARLIHIYSFDITSFNPPDVSFKMRCSKGTYVRTVCADVGEILGCGAHLASLHRVTSGSLRVEDAIPFEDLMLISDNEMAKRILPVSRFATASSNR